MATSCEELTHWKRPWYWERLRAAGEGDDRGWDGWMASPTQWTWVWIDSRIWWWTGRPGVLQFMVSQRVGQDLATELNWDNFYNITYWKVCHGQWLPAMPPLSYTLLSYTGDFVYSGLLGNDAWRYLEKWVLRASISSNYFCS